MLEEQRRFGTDRTQILSQPQVPVFDSSMPPRRLQP